MNVNGSYMLRLRVLEELVRVVKQHLPVLPTSEKVQHVLRSGPPVLADYLGIAALIPVLETVAARGHVSRQFCVIGRIEGTLARFIAKRGRKLTAVRVYLLLDWVRCIMLRCEQVLIVENNFPRGRLSKE